MFKSSNFYNISNSKMILFDIHQSFKGHFLNELRVSFNIHKMFNWNYDNSINTLEINWMTIKQWKAKKRIHNLQ